MIIGTVRLEEAKALDSSAGEHVLFDGERNDATIEVFWALDGWRWSLDSQDPDCFQGGGPFASSSQALQDAQDWWADPESEAIHACL